MRRITAEDLRRLWATYLAEYERKHASIWDEYKRHFAPIRGEYVRRSVGREVVR